MAEIALPVVVVKGRTHAHLKDSAGRYLADCGKGGYGDLLAAALNDHAALQAQVAALTAERDEWHMAVMLCLAGLVGTPERGYVEDGGPKRAQEDALEMRGLVDRLRKQVAAVRVLWEAANAHAEEYGGRGELGDALELLAPFMARGGGR